MQFKVAAYFGLQSRQALQLVSHVVRALLKGYRTARRWIETNVIAFKPGPTAVDRLQACLRTLDRLWDSCSPRYGQHYSPAKN